jgi:hypothetical protein
MLTVLSSEFRFFAKPRNVSPNVKTFIPTRMIIEIFGCQKKIKTDQGSDSLTNDQKDQRTVVAESAIC